MKQTIPDQIRAAIREFGRATEDEIAAALPEEVGELTKAVLQCTYELDKKVTADDILAEGVRVIAMAVRFLVNFDRYNYVPASQMKDEDDPLQRRTFPASPRRCLWICVWSFFD